MTEEEIRDWTCRPRRGPGPSGWIGVSWDQARGKWLAVMRVGGRLYRVGRFDTPESAAKARAEAMAAVLANQPR